MGGIGSGGQNRLRPYESLYRLLRRVARKKHRRVMSFKDFLSFVEVKECFYCGDDIEWKLFKSHGAGYNLDRRDSSRSYDKRNCVVCCGICNTMKSTLTEREFYTRLRHILRRQHARYRNRRRG